MNFYQKLLLLSYQYKLSSLREVVNKSTTTMWRDKNTDIRVANNATRHLLLLHDKYKSSPGPNSYQSLPSTEKEGLSLSDLVNWLTSKFFLGQTQVSAVNAYRFQLEENKKAQNKREEFERNSNTMQRLLMKNFFKVVTDGANQEVVSFEKFVELMASQMIPRITVTKEEFGKLFAQKNFQIILQILDTIQGFIVPNLETLAHFESDPKKYYHKIGASLERSLSQAIAFETLFSLLAEERLILLDERLFFPSKQWVF